MSFPRTPVPPTIGTSDGILVKTYHAKEMQNQFKNQLSPEKTLEFN